MVETKVVPRRIIHSEEFFTQLGYLVELWKFIGVNGVEVIVHSRDAKVVPELIKRGYNFYKVVERKLVLNRWIAEGPSQFPLHETIVMAVEALVVDDSGRILMIRDKQNNCWKFPGGIPIENESVFETALRAVEYKTGVYGVVTTIISINHNNRENLMYGTVSGMFFVCLMKYKSGDAAAHGEDVLEAAWFTRAQLQKFDHMKISQPHMQIFNDYESLIMSGSISQTGDVKASSMVYNFRR